MRYNGLLEQSAEHMCRIAGFARAGLGQDSIGTGTVVFLS